TGHVHVRRRALESQERSVEVAERLVVERRHDPKRRDGERIPSLRASGSEFLHPCQRLTGRLDLVGRRPDLLAKTQGVLEMEAGDVVPAFLEAQLAEVLV